MKCKWLVVHQVCPSSGGDGHLQNRSDASVAVCQKDVRTPCCSACLQRGCGTCSPGCAAQTLLSPAQGRDSLSEDSGYSSLLSVSSPAAKEDGSLTPKGDLGAGQHWDQSQASEEEAAQEPGRKAVRTGQWHLLPALQVGRAVCQNVRQAKGLHPGSYSPTRGQTFPIDRLIGRKMGLEHVDIWAELWERGFLCILRRILLFLSPTDLFSCVKVCKMWKRIIRSDRRANQTLKKASRLQKLEASKRERVASRGALVSIQHQSGDSVLSKLWPSRQPKVGGDSQKSIRHQQVVKTLRQDEVLKMCPLCSFPAKFLPYQERAVCTSDLCSYDYCSLCLSSFHGSKSCIRRSFHSGSRAQAAVGSKRSKQNLRRL
ncbi:F-box only protein 5-like [Hypanus sabinus]|uniref:F-box only protein 5-like n=1 Tax=Hypanus sabinus TaxID=79690 RepID=UPI0028C3EC6E|nr:F-box only protein 5-like [Hypanus sabinus]XP_059841274.1 F-box only protein 5-like [Hypanus sabinus]XP_059841275.1 F-box only protein 5-like [Hypanus sabinus]